MEVKGKGKEKLTEENAEDGGVGRKDRKERG